MLCMAFEREVILNIRHWLEMYEQQRLFEENADEEDIPSVAEFSHSHVHLGSRQHSLKLPTYEGILKEELGLPDFGDSLTKFLREYAGVDVYGSDFEGDGFKGHQHCIYYCKVFFLLCLYSPLWLIDDRSSPVFHAKSHSIAKKPQFKRRKSFTSPHCGAIQVHDMIW